MQRLELALLLVGAGLIGIGLSFDHDGLLSFFTWDNKPAEARAAFRSPLDNASGVNLAYNSTQRGFVASGSPNASALTHSPSLSPSMHPTSSPRHAFFLKLHLVGRLGNHIFLWASGEGIAASNKAQLCIDDLDLSETFVGPFPGDCPHRHYQRVTGPGHGRYKDVEITSDTVFAKGSYLQSFKYFASIEIRSKLQFLPTYRQKASNFFSAHGLKDVTRIGLHVRRTDFLTLNINRFPPHQYFRNAMNYFRVKYDNIVFIVASDDYDWCFSHADFNSSEVYIIGPGNEAATDMAILSGCNHTITAGGTFAWWSAYLAGGDVIYYNNEWNMEHKLNRGGQFNPDDFYPPAWISMGEEQVEKNLSSLR